MKYGFFCYLLFFSTWGYGQRWKWEHEKLAIRDQIARIESDSALFKLTGKEKDSLQAVYLGLVEELRQKEITEDSFFLVARSINEEAARIHDILERNEVASAAQKDSLSDVYNHMIERSFSITEQFHFFPDKRDTFNRLLFEIDLHGPGWDKAITDLIRMISATDSHSLIQYQGFLKVAESRHPAALSFLMDNLMNFAGQSSPTDFGEDPSFYVWTGNYPCYKYLVEYSKTGYNMGWHLLPDFKRVLSKQLIPEKYISLYATLLETITRDCKPCRDVLLEQYLKEPDSSKQAENKRANILQIIKFYKDPVDLFKEFREPKKTKE